ncbi:hypothetical protein BKA23_2081 [Rudaeicoccus suwonensis]|uniref:Uncharacterized protein n=2 Tax=Rudaeicoccus suwonensis TaxID=657409 RepID=A0A561ECC1_9MICO|nr:hypothetical protein BKA23_2081 [Rudaeicoccus suwonensis]
MLPESNSSERVWRGSCTTCGWFVDGTWKTAGDATQAHSDVCEDAATEMREAPSQALPAPAVEDSAPAVPCPTWCEQIHVNKEHFRFLDETRTLDDDLLNPWIRVPFDGSEAPHLVLNMYGEHVDHDVTLTLPQLRHFISTLTNAADMLERTNDDA